VIGSLRFRSASVTHPLPGGDENGLFAKLSILELAPSRHRSGSCSTYLLQRCPAWEGLPRRLPACTQPRLTFETTATAWLILTSPSPARNRSRATEPEALPAPDLQTRDVPPREAGLILCWRGRLPEVLSGCWGLGAAPSSLAARTRFAALAFAAWPGPAVVLLFSWRCGSPASFAAGFLRLRPPAAAGLYWLFVPLLWALLLARHLSARMDEAGMVPVAAGVWPGPCPLKAPIPT